MSKSAPLLSRRSLILKSGAALIGATIFPIFANATTYMALEEARTLLWGDEAMEPVVVTLTKAQRKAIKKTSRTNVPKWPLKAWRTESGGWFIVEQIIGKHENIDAAFAINADGSLKDFEILVYRESYGHEVMNRKWRNQFRGRTHEKVLRLDKDIVNISGATLSCVHLMKGVNRLLHTWDQVLRYM